MSAGLVILVHYILLDSAIDLILDVSFLHSFISTTKFRYNLQNDHVTLFKLREACVSSFQNLCSME